MKENKLEDLFKVLGLILLFGGGFLAVLILYAWPSIGHMATYYPGLLILGLISAALGVVASYFALKEWKDPGYDGWRKVLMAAFIVALLVFGGYRSQHNFDKQDNIAPTAQLK